MCELIKADEMITISIECEEFDDLTTFLEKGEFL